MNNNLEKAKGKVEEVTGKVTHDEELEAKGRVNQKVATAKQDIKETVENAKQKTAKKTNDILDKVDK